MTSTHKISDVHAVVRRGRLGAAGVLLALLGGGCTPSAPADTAAGAKPALTVTVTQATPQQLALRVSANGSIAAWQEASVGTEAHGLRLAEVRANVGDTVKRGHVLARFAPETVQADLSQIRASVAEAEAALAEAAANAQRARDLSSTGALSAQQIQQFLTAERMAQARVSAQQAAAKTQALRLSQTEVRAPDDGVISARSATVGAVLPAGQELFRLIRQGRLEWRAEVPAADLNRLRPGMAVTVRAEGGGEVKGTVRMLAPTVDPQTRSALVYVDLPRAPTVRAGMFARGEFELGHSEALTLPQSAVLLRDGFSFALVVEGDQKVRAQKLQVGRRVGDRVEVLDGLPAGAQVVASGGGFLADGDLVRVVSAPDARLAPAAMRSAPTASAPAAASGVSAGGRP